MGTDGGGALYGGHGQGDHHAADESGAARLAREERHARLSAAIGYAAALRVMAAEPAPAVEETAPA